MSEPKKGTDSDIDIDKLRILADLAAKRSSGNRAYTVGTVLGILIGALFCIAGFIICILGLTGSIEWIFEAENIRTRLTNASPGAFFALLGMIVLWRYKPRIKDELDLGPLSSHHVMYHKNIISPLEKIEKSILKHKREE